MTTAAALGFRAHSGWAMLVALAGPSRSPSVLERRRIELAAPGLDGSNQPYHAAEDLPLERARSLVKRCHDGACRLAQRAVSAAVDGLQAKGYRVVGSGLLLASGRPLPELPAILASHALIHSAEGELFRDALVQASEGCRLPVLRVKERELMDLSAAALDQDAPRIQEQLAAWGKALGPPWRQDEKLAALVAWLALSRKS